MSDDNVDDAFAPLGGGEPDAKEESEVPVTPVPLDAPKAGFRHFLFGDASAWWAYRSERGELLGYAVRFDVEGGKQVLPRTWCKLKDGGAGWQWKAFVRPRPLFGLDRLAEQPAAPVLVVEGEKTAEAAQALLDNFVVVTWPGGAKAASRADFRPLQGRPVTLWPDADEDGATAMRDLRHLLWAAGVASVRCVHLPEGLTNGWDLADQIPEGLDVRRMLEAASPIAKPPLLPPGYRLSSRGLVWCEDEKPDLLLSGPFDVLAETRDGEGAAWGVLLSWKDHDGRQHEQALPRSILAGDGADARRLFLDRGLSVAPGKKARDKLNEFLSMVRSSERAKATARIGWHEGVFVLPDASIGTAAGHEKHILQHTGSFKHAFRQRGELAAWQENVARLADGNSRLVLAISIALAAALIEPCNAESGGIHLRGPSSTGKSTALIMAASVWGGGEPSYVRSWRATSNGLEGVALGHCDALLCLDELSQVPSREAGEVAYMLANGSGKARSSREGLAKASAQWRSLFLSSGELSLAEKMAEDGRGRRAAAGQLVRLIDLPADAGAGLGLFEHLHGVGSPDAFARQIKTMSTQYYGTAARAFLAHLAHERQEIAEAAVVSCKKFITEHVPGSADGQVVRVAQRFGLVGAAGEIAISLGILPWQAGSAFKAAGRCLKDWIGARGGTEPAEIQNGLAQVRAFVSAHGLARFVAAWDDTESAAALRDVAGYRKREGDGWDYYVTTSCWKEEICRGFDPVTIAAKLAEIGLLIVGESGRYSASLRVPGHGKQRLYHLASRLLEQSHD